MEGLLQSFEHDRLRDEATCNGASVKRFGKNKQLTSACTAFAKALNDLAIQYA